MSWMLSLKVFLISAAVLFTALGIKASLPLATAHLPLLCNFIILCFKPPYLYLILNAIIITIVATSRFNHSTPQPNHPPPPSIPPSYDIKNPSHFAISEPPLLELKAVLVNGSPAVDDDDDEEEEEEEIEEEKGIDEGSNSMEESTWAPLKRMDSTEIPPEYPSPTEKPLVSTRFAHRKPLKFTPEGGRALRAVAKPKRHDTLENTWKAITEGRSMPLSRHMKKCDTWQSRGSVGPPEMKKSETFRDRTNQPQHPVSVTAGKLRKEPSLSQDELNRRVEAFIQKFNEQMRLQRQESLNQYMQMINGGST